MSRHPVQVGRRSAVAGRAVALLGLLTLPLAAGTVAPHDPDAQRDTGAQTRTGGQPKAGDAARKSAVLAPRLAAILRARPQHAIAVHDAIDPQRFSAAQLNGGTELLVVTARRPERDIGTLKARIAHGDDKEVFADLRGTTISEGQMLVEDSGADGLSARPHGQRVDVVYENGGRQLVGDGSAAAQHTTQRQYVDRFQAAELRYAGILAKLIAGANAAAQP